MGLIAGLDAATLAEKLRPPRALTAVGGSLWAEPAPASTTAWLAWWSGAPAELSDVVARARAVGATRLVAGGPPGNYVQSGVDAARAERVEALVAAGFVTRGRHVDLEARTVGPARPAAGVTVARCGDELGAEIRAVFGDGWAWEAARARSHDALFAAYARDGAWLGFAAHSGNLAHRGTFGPIGVLAAARGRGVGAALASAVFADLQARGFECATVPWVEPATGAFYESLVTISARTNRLVMALDLTGTGSP